MKLTYKNFRLFSRIFIFQNYQLAHELILETADSLAEGIDTVFSFTEIHLRRKYHGIQCTVSDLLQ